MLIFPCLAVNYLDFRQVSFVKQGPSVAPKKTVKASDSSSVAVGGSDGLPREDISAKITPTLLKNFESPDWKVFSQVTHSNFS